MAEIFVARQWGDGGFHREVVIKRLHPHLSEKRQLLNEFCREGRWMARIEHAGLPSIHDLRHEDGYWYCAMERLQGLTLGGARRHEREMGRTMRWDVVFSVALQLCDVLQAVHEQADEAGQPVGLIHGDIGPENVFLGRDGRVRLIDFGLCTDAEDRRALKAAKAGIRGTVGYIAPETIASIDSSDRRADLYVVGVLLYELTTGERMIPGDGMSYVNAVLAGPPPAPSTRTEREYPPALEAVVMRCLQRDPAKRFGDVRKLAMALRNLAKTLQLRVGHDVLAAYVSALAPVSEEPVRPRTMPPPFVVDTDEVLEPEPIDDSVLSSEEHDELLADLELFSAEALGPSPSSPALSFDDDFDDAQRFRQPTQTQTRARHPGIPEEGDFVIAFNEED